jgi:hypothetical protein
MSGKNKEGRDGERGMMQKLCNGDGAKLRRKAKEEGKTEA